MCLSASKDSYISQWVKSKWYICLSTFKTNTFIIDVTLPEILIRIYILNNTLHSCETKKKPLPDKCTI